MPSLKLLNAFLFPRTINTWKPFSIKNIIPITFNKQIVYVCGVKKNPAKTARLINIVTVQILRSESTG